MDPLLQDDEVHGNRTRVVDDHLDVTYIPPHLVSVVEKNAVDSPLLRLPGELRNKIWGYIAADIVLIVHCASYKGQVIACRYTNDRSTKQAFQIPQVCRQIYAETRFLLFSASRAFCVNNSDVPEGRSLRTCELIDVDILSQAQVHRITTVVPAWRADVGFIGPWFPKATHAELWEDWRGELRDASSRRLQIRWHKGRDEYPQYDEPWALLPEAPPCECFAEEREGLKRREIEIFYYGTELGEHRTWEGFWLNPEEGWFPWRDCNVTYVTKSEYNWDPADPV